ncbi:recombination-associated protein RdgC [Ferrovum sp.]|uniref:recombination-associated protein RdgC n=1 Tax=Ferrovum sp. TaxID=2609467 RepID=UPI00260B49A8|nr:recombination-associated protein RdgC [Ferrovum sp.]
MWFKNLVLYRLGDWKDSAESLSERLSHRPLQSCTGSDLQRNGWLPPNDEDFVYTLPPHLLICLGIEKKLLPASVIAQQARQRAEEFEHTRGYKPGRKQMKDIKEEVTDELLPRAFSVQRRTHAWIDPQNHWLAVDSANPGRAEEVLETLRKCGVEFSAAPLRTRLSPVTAMTQWLVEDTLPAVFTIDQDCELRARQDERMKVRYAHHSLEGAEIRQHVQGGKEVSRLALTWGQKISFVLDEALQLRRLSPHDILSESSNAGEEAFDNDFTLMTSEFSHLIRDLVEALDGVDER